MAWADPEVRRRCSDCHAEHTTEYRLDFRPLGHETHHVTFPDGRIQEIEKVFFDISDARRIVLPTTFASTDVASRLRW
jgi:hypothetical protein